MNIQNINELINLMHEATNLNMLDFQLVMEDNERVYSIEELHACGNKACVAGYMVMSPYFNEHYKLEPRKAAPLLQLGDSGLLNVGDTVAYMLDIPLWAAERLIYGSIRYYPVDDINEDIDYPKDVHFHELEPHHVITLLQTMLDKYSNDDTFVYSSKL